MKSSSLSPTVQSRIVSGSPFYYGWVIIALGALGLFMSAPGQTLGVSVFLDSIIASLGVSRESVSLMYMLGTLVASFWMPFVGRMLDKRGPRLVGGVVVGCFALACVYMGQVRTLVMLGFGFVLIRALGQGALCLVSLYAVNQWFVRRRGFSIALAGLGGAMMFVLVPPFIEGLILDYGWRTAYTMLGGILAGVLLPLFILLLRGRPEQYGLLPDGGGSQKQLASDIKERHFTPSQAYRTMVYWVFVLGGFSVAALSTGLVFHHFDILAFNGVSRTGAVLVLSVMGLIAAGANFITGMLLDRVDPRFVLMFKEGCLLVALLSAPLVHLPWHLMGYGVLLGLINGIGGALGAVVFAYYFGREHLGEIKGNVATIGVIGTSVGPLIFALGKGMIGNYTLVLALCALMPLTIMILALCLQPAKLEQKGT